MSKPYVPFRSYDVDGCFVRGTLLMYRNKFMNVAGKIYVRDDAPKIGDRLPPKIGGELLSAAAARLGKKATVQGLIASIYKPSTHPATEAELKVYTAAKKRLDDHIAKEKAAKAARLRARRLREVKAARACLAKYGAEFPESAPIVPAAKA